MTSTETTFTLLGVTVHVWQKSDSTWWAYAGGEKFGPCDSEDEAMEKVQGHVLASEDMDAEVCH